VKTELFELAHDLLIGHEGNDKLYVGAIEIACNEQKVQIIFVLVFITKYRIDNNANVRYSYVSNQ
jgi:hypothetical protein